MVMSLVDAKGKVGNRHCTACKRNGVSQVQGILMCDPAVHLIMIAVAQLNEFEAHVKWRWMPNWSSSRLLAFDTFFPFVVAELSWMVFLKYGHL